MPLHFLRHFGFKEEIAYSQGEKRKWVGKNILNNEHRIELENWGKETKNKLKGTRKRTENIYPHLPFLQKYQNKIYKGKQHCTQINYQQQQQQKSINK